jgi:hypothetical protein
LLTLILVVAIVGIGLLAAAVLTDNTIVALIVIAIAIIGLVLLARDWLDERRQREPEQRQPVEHAGDDNPAVHSSDESPLEPDQFEPDVPYEESGDNEFHAANNDNT